MFSGGTANFAPCKKQHVGPTSVRIGTTARNVGKMLGQNLSVNAATRGETLN